jgi:glycosyltransferase involved in cell wall biosynthesis
MSLSQPRLGEVGIIALVPDRWGSQWMDRHHMLSRLAGYFQVVWMTQPGWRDSLSSLYRLRTPSADDAPVMAGLQVYEPGFWLPKLARPSGLARFTSRQRLEHARKLLRARGCTKIVLYICRPDFGDALVDIAHDLSIYYVSDEYSFTTTEVAVSLTERRLLESVGQVFLTSPALVEKRGSFNPNTEFVPMGVDYRKFATPAPEPEDLRAIPYPRIGYVGHLKQMLDWPLMVELSAVHPQWSFVFVGPKSPHPKIESALKELSSRPNVYFLGGKPTECLGSYPQHFDVSIMPYRLDDYTKYVYPLKMHEYLASGKPVVSTPIRSVEDFSHVIAMATSREEWSHAIERALSGEENTPHRCAERQRAAHDYDWDPLVDRMARIIAGRLGLQVPASGPEAEHILASSR